MSGRVWQCRDMGAGLSAAPCPVLPTRSDPLLAGLPRDSDYSLPCYCSSPSPSNLCSLDNSKCDKYWGSLRSCSRAGELGGAGVLWVGPQDALTHPPLGTSSDKNLDYTIHWSSTPEPETSGPAASENTVTIIDWKPGRDSGPQSHGSPHFPNSGSRECCNDQELVKKRSSIIKVTRTLEPPSCCTAIYCCRAWWWWWGGVGETGRSSAPRTPPSAQQACNEYVLMDEGMNGMDVGLCVLVESFLSLSLAMTVCLCLVMYLR